METSLEQPLFCLLSGPRGSALLGRLHLFRNCLLGSTCQATHSQGALFNADNVILADRSHFRLRLKVPSKINFSFGVLDYIKQFSQTCERGFLE